VKQSGIRTNGGAEPHRQDYGSWDRRWRGPFALSTLVPVRLVAPALPLVAVMLAVLGGVARGEALVPIGGSFGSTPVYITAPPEDPRLFVVERAGAIRVVEDGVLKPTPFLTIPNVDTRVERGLSSMAFAPDYTSSGVFYVFVTPDGTDGDLEVLQYRRSATDPDLADPTSRRLVLLQHHPSSNNHYGSQLAFGPDGYLYVTVGDGQRKNANGQTISGQATNTLLGKVLRIDPRQQSGGAPYGIPPDNPYAADPRCGPDDGSAPCPEIYAYGFRNPYRASFDGPTGDFVLADVGEDTWEEVDLVRRGANYGWGLCEGDHNTGTESAGCTDLQTQTPPLFEYHHDATNCAVIGGYVVHDPSLPNLDGRYLYGDYCASELRTLDLSVPGGDPQPTGLHAASPFSLDSFGTDARGCIYALADDTVYRIAAATTESFACSGGAVGSPSPPATAPNATTGASNASAADGSATIEPASTNPAPLPLTEGVTPPALRLAVRDAQRLGRRRQIGIRVTCDENCTLTASGTLRLPVGAARSWHLSGSRKSAVAGQRVTLKLKLSRTLAAHAREAIKDGHHVTARVKLTARDDAGNASRRTLRIRLL